MSVIVKLKTMDTITITATRKEATIVLNYKGKTYTQKCIPTRSGARYEGCNFSDEPEIPDELADELEGFTSYNLMRVLERAR